jgi:hypothetical protein
MCHHIKLSPKWPGTRSLCTHNLQGIYTVSYLKTGIFQNSTHFKSRQWTEVSDRCMPQPWRDCLEMAANGKLNCYWEWNPSSLPCSHSLLTEPLQAQICIDNCHIFNLQTLSVNLDFWLPLKLCISYTHIWLLPTVHQMDRRPYNNFIVNITDSQNECYTDTV